jgi:hypothetical protein
MNAELSLARKPDCEIDREVLAELLEVYSSYYDMMDAAFIANNATRLSREVERGERNSVTKDDFFAWRQR